MGIIKCDRLYLQRCSLEVLEGTHELIVANGTAGPPGGIRCLRLCNLNERVTSTGRAVENPNGGASFLASLRQPTPPPRLGPAQAGGRAWVPGGYCPG